MSHGAVQVQLDVTDVQAGVLLRAAGARRFAFNSAVAKVKANADQWAVEGSYGIERPDRVRPLTFFTLAKMWTAEKPDVAPWAHEHSTWTFRYALRQRARGVPRWQAAVPAVQGPASRPGPVHRPRRPGAGGRPGAAGEVRVGPHRR